MRLTKFQTPTQTAPSVDFVEVTPLLAQQWLDRHNTSNRRINDRAVTKYAIDMSSGRWRHRTGEPIIFDRIGRLQQGQHRLAAVVKSGVSITFMVVFDADPDDFKVLDQGLKRSSGQVLQMAGVQNANLISSMSRVILLHMNYADRLWSGVQNLTQQEVIAYAQDNLEEMQLAAAHASTARRTALLPETNYGAICYMVRAKSNATEAFERFHHQVSTGEMLRSGDAAFALRRWGVNRRAGQLARNSGNLATQSASATIAKAWNAFVSDRRMSIVGWKKTELPTPTPVTSPY